MCELVSARRGIRLACVLFDGESWTVDEIAHALDITDRQAARYLAMLQEEFELSVEVDRHNIKRWRLADE